MPIVINDLHIRVAVEGSAQQPQPRQDRVPAAGPVKDAIVAECVEEVMRILQAKRER